MTATGHIRGRAVWFDSDDATPRDPIAPSECAWCHGKPAPHEVGCPWEMAIEHVKHMGDET